MAETTIEWTDVTDNVTVVADGGWFCKHVHEGCDNCYAEKLNRSTFYGGNQQPYAGAAPVMKLREDIIDSWPRQRKPKKHFVESMSDVFGEWIPRDWIFRVLDGMAAAPKQMFQVLSKRPAIMRREVTAWLAARNLSRVPSNIWLGVSVSKQSHADAFIPIIVNIPAVLFVSAEPLLGGIDLTRIVLKQGVKLEDGTDTTVPVEINALAGTWVIADGVDRGRCTPIAWVIVGGESGPHARPIHPQWARDLRDQCTAAAVAFFFKQWGGWSPILDRDREDPDGRADYVKFGKSKRHTYINLAGGSGFHGDRIFVMERVGKKAAGRILDWREWSQFPEVAP